MPKKEMESIAEREQRAAEAKRKSFVDALSEEPELQRRKDLSGEKLKQKSYYVTEEQHRKLKMWVAMGYDENISAAVRAAINLYLSEHANDTKDI